MTRIDLVTFGAANLQLLSRWPWLLYQLEPSWVRVHVDTGEHLGELASVPVA